MNLEQIQTALREQQLDGWLFYDHHHRDPIAYRILGLSDSLHVHRGAGTTSFQPRANRAS
jgi:Xaa-Pro dipeptidase